MTLARFVTFDCVANQCNWKRKEFSFRMDCKDDTFLGDAVVIQELLLGSGVDDGRPGSIIYKALS
jgi:hypothetical protein